MTTKIWMRVALSLALIGTLALVTLLAGANASAQKVLTGEWTASLTKDNSKIHLGFALSKQGRGKQQYGQTYEFGELSLSREQVMKGGPVKFSLAREAGTRFD